jgi:hypothetical protein
MPLRDELWPARFAGEDNCLKARTGRDGIEIAAKQQVRVI